MSRPGMFSMMTAHGAPPPAGFSPVQVQAVVFQSGTTAATYTINNANSGLNAPVSGRLLIMGVVADTTISDASLTAAGWVQRALSVDFTGSYIYTKISNGTENSITVNLAGIGSCCIGVIEVNTVTTFDQKANTTGQGTATISTGVTPATTGANEFVVALAGLSFGNATIPPTVTSWSNGFTTVISGVSANTVRLRIYMAFKIVTATGTQTAVATLSGAGSANNSGMIVTFK